MLAAIWLSIMLVLLIVETIAIALPYGSISRVFPVIIRCSLQAAPIPICVNYNVTTFIAATFIASICFVRLSIYLFSPTYFSWGSLKFNRVCLFLLGCMFRSNARAPDQAELLS